MPHDAQGRWLRGDYVFKGRVTADGSSGFKAEPGRYHLYVSLACPWAHRSVIVRRLKRLEDVVGMTVVDPIRDERGWAFSDGDPVNGFAFLREAYRATDPDYEGNVTVPVMWDRATGRIVSNHFPDLTIDLETQFEDWADRSVDLYPEDLRPAIDEVNALVYTHVNNGVYRCGFANSQFAYDEAFDGLFATLDHLDGRLAHRRYLCGDRLTEADVRLFTTLVRFDAVYALHFKCNLRRLVDYPHLWPYARDLYQTPGFGDTTDSDHIKRHYYCTQPHLNPKGIVPKGPETQWFAPHERDIL